MKKIYLFTLTFLVSSIAVAQNPIIGNIGISDPHIRVFDNAIYLYSGHDSSPQDTTFIMKDWRVFSTTDLVNWTQKAPISPKDNYMGEGNVDCHAGDAAERNGKYYFYFSDESRGIGVMSSKSPAGPFKDALGKAVVSPYNDPTIFIDDDKAKTPYIVYAKKSAGGFHIAKLNDDMISVAETPKIIKINGSAWERAIEWQDKNYLFKYKDTYYLSWGGSYATSKNVYGPYECVGSVGRGFNLNMFAHGSFFWWKGQFYHAWCYYTIHPKIKYRATIISYCHFDDDGKIVTDTDFLDKHFSNGMGQYNASWPKIEAEWFYEISANIQKTGTKENGFVLSNIKNGDWVRFANVTFDKPFAKFTANVALEGKSGLLEIRTDSPKGNLLGKINLDPNTSLKEVSCKIKEFTGKKDVYLVFKGSGSAMKMDWFNFK